MNMTNPTEERLYLYGPWFKQPDGSFGNKPMPRTDKIDDTQGSDIADELQRLCCAETEGQFFDYVTECVGTISKLLRERDCLKHDLAVVESLDLPAAKAAHAAIVRALEGR